MPLLLSVPLLKEEAEVRIAWGLSLKTHAESQQLLWLCFQICPGRVVQLGIKNSVAA